MSWPDPQYSSRDPYYYGKQKTDAEKKQELLEMRQRANRNLARIAAGEFRTTEPKKPRREPVSALDIMNGHDILEMRDLRKLELQYSRRADKGKLDQQGMGEWEEVDHQYEKLAERFRHFTKAETMRCVKAYNKSLKTKVQPNG